MLDIVPTGDAFESAGMEFSLGFWVWSFPAAPHPVPEQLIGASPAALVEHMLDSWADDDGAFPDEVRKIYVDKFSPPETIHAICGQYRDAATLDYEHDMTDRGSKTIESPVLAVWSSSGAVAAWYNPLDVWRNGLRRSAADRSTSATSYPKKLRTRQLSG